MKITDIITESKQVNEAPVGMLKRAGMGIAAKLGSHTAAGGLETAKLANNLKNAYSKYLGKSRQKPNSDNILAFLRSNGLPTDAAEQEIKQAAASAGVQLKPAKDMKQTLGIGKNAGGPGAIPNPKEPTGPIDAGGAETDLDVPAFQRRGMAAPETEPFDAEKFKQSNVKAKLKGGRGIAKQSGAGFSKAVAAGRAKGLNMSHTPDGVPVMEVDLKSSTIDKIILAAVADAEKLNMGQELAAAASGDGGNVQQGGGSGGGAVSNFIKGVKRGATGQDDQAGAADSTLQGNVNFSQLSQFLPGVDPKVMASVVNRIKQGKEPSVQQMAQLGTAFVALLKADPQSKQAAINILKKMQAG